MKTVFSTGSEPRAGVVSAGKMLLEKTNIDVATIGISAFTPLKYTSRVAFAIPSLRRAVPPLPRTAAATTIGPGFRTFS